MVRGHKYHAKPTVVDGVRFASKREARRYTELKLLERAGQITGLELQPAFDLTVHGVKVCRYVADFRYEEAGQVVIEDAKGLRTRIYAIKCKLMKAIHGIEIRET